MRKLSRVRFTPAPNLPDPESQDVQLGSQLLIAGKDRGFNQHGEKLVDVELTDDEVNRRVILQAEGEEDSFVPYERVCKGWFATPDPIDPALIEAQRELWLEATADNPYHPRTTAAREAAARDAAVNCVDATAGPTKEPQEPYAQSGWQSVAASAAEAFADKSLQATRQGIAEGRLCRDCDFVAKDSRGLAAHVRARHP